MDPSTVDPTLKAPFAIIHRGAGIPVVFYFPLAPQDALNEFPPRVAVHQTLESNFVDDFSGRRAVLARVTLRGTWGFTARHGGIGIPLPGSGHLKVFETILATYNGLSRRLKAQVKARQEYVNLGRLHFWRIVIDRFTYRISDRNPLLYFYELSFRRLEDYLSPTGPSLPGRTSAPDVVGFPSPF
jgi:hypothetical protein